MFLFNLISVNVYFNIMKIFFNGFSFNDNIPGLLVLTQWKKYNYLVISLFVRC